jgi:NAD(P)H-dependent FMN reductase
MKDQYTIPVLLGTARNGNHSQKAFSFIVDYLQDKERVDLKPVRVADFPLERTHEAWNDHGDTPAVGKWRKIASEADGFIIMLPEYNHGYPGELKILLDSAFSEYADKPVMLVGLSGGDFGGARVVDHIKPILTAMGMRPIGADVHVTNLSDTFSEGGKISDVDRGKYTERIDTAVSLLLDHAEGMRGVRDDS